MPPPTPSVNSPLYMMVAVLYPASVVCGAVISLKEIVSCGFKIKPLNFSSANFTLCFLPPVLSATFVENVAIFCVRVSLYSLVIVGISSIKDRSTFIVFEVKNCSLMCRRCHRYSESMEG